MQSAILTLSLGLQWHYKILQSLALEEELPEHPDDKTVPRYRQIDKVKRPSMNPGLQAGTNIPSALDPMS